MTLLLDNRKDEMSPLVHTRMLYVRDHTRQDIEQILYFSRLGATHKDYFFEPLSILEICREAVEDNLTLLEEAGFSVEYTENDAQVISDKKGLMFILGQIISNSVKYTGNNPAPRLLFSIADSADNEQISLSMKDNSRLQKQLKEQKKEMTVNGIVSFFGKAGVQRKRSDSG